MAILYTVLLLVILFLAWRIKSPGDLRLTKRYLGRYLQDSAGQGPVRIGIEKLSADRLPGTPEERVFYHVTAAFGDGSQESVLAQVVYPLEELHLEREQRNMPGGDDATMMPDMTEMHSSADVSAKLKEDPFKDQVAVEKATAAKIAQVNQEVSLLRMFSANCPLFPNLIAHDEQRLITITGAVGQERLDSFWQNASGEERKTLMEGLMQSMAAFHSCGTDYAALLPPGAGHTASAMVEALRTSLVNGWGMQGEELGFALTAMSPLYLTADLPQGPRLFNSSPRGFFVADGLAQSPHWAGLRFDVSGLDVVELLSDPALDLAAEQETAFFTLYLEKLAEVQGSEEGVPALIDMRHLAVYYQIVLLGHLALFTATDKKALGAGAMAIPYWSAASVPALARKLTAHLKADEELAPLFSLLEDRLQSFANQMMNNPA